MQEKSPGADGALASRRIAMEELQRELDGARAELLELTNRWVCEDENITIGWNVTLGIGGAARERR